MKISTKGRYALRIMLNLAEKYNLGCVTIKDIAQEEELSIKYLEHIMSILTKAGFIMSTRGSHGGYQLKKEPVNYTVGQIIRLMEGSLAPVTCLEQTAEPCPRFEKCVTVEIYQLIQVTINELLDNLTLIDLLRMQQEKLGKPSLYLTYLLHTKKE